MLSFYQFIGYPSNQSFQSHMCVCIGWMCLYQNLILPTLMMVYSSWPKQIWSSISRHQLYCQTETYFVRYIGYSIMNNTKYFCQYSSYKYAISIESVLLYSMTWIVRLTNYILIVWINRITLMEHDFKFITRTRLRYRFIKHISRWT